MKFRWAIGISLGAFVGFYSTRLYRYVMGVQSITCTIDPRIAHAMQTTIQNYVHTQKADELWNTQSLREQFTFLDAIAVRRNQRTIHYDFESVAPLVVANSDWIVGQNGRIYNKKIFNARVCNTLHAITINGLDSKDKVSQEFLTTMQQHILPDLANHYAITWFDEKKIQLRDKEKPSLILVCSADSLPTAATLNTCHHLFEELKGTISEKKLRHIQWWLADIRFKNQIIITAEKGGIIYG